MSCRGEPSRAARSATISLAPIDAAYESRCGSLAAKPSSASPTSSRRSGACSARSSMCRAAVKPAVSPAGSRLRASSRRADVRLMAAARPGTVHPGTTSCGSPPRTPRSSESRRTSRRLRTASPRCGPLPACPPASSHRIAQMWAGSWIRARISAPHRPDLRGSGTDEECRVSQVRGARWPMRPALPSTLVPTVHRDKMHQWR